MVDDGPSHWIVPTRGALTLPSIEVLTGRGFITGKSGSGKSNTASVIAEELLDNSYNLLIVDPEGEYYGLKEEYELLHVGNDDHCDIEATPDDAEQLATIALERNLPIIIDVSDYLDPDEPKELIANTLRQLFIKEKEARKPFLVMIEEMQEYLPQQGGTDELGEMLERVAKRGRKRGLGMLGMSQRPSSVDKDFITQCDWMVWHRLTWQNDIDVVKKVLGSAYADDIEDLDTGEGFLMTDWDEEIERVKFKQKRTHDAGATPGLENYERPDMNAVRQDLGKDFRTTDPDATLDDRRESPVAEEQPTTDERDVTLDSLSTDLPEGDTPLDERREQAESDDRSLVQSEPPDSDGRSAPVSGSHAEEAYRERVQTLRRENQQLREQLEELRSAVRDGDASAQTAARVAGESTSSGERVVSPERGRTEPPSPTRPVPPEPPAERQGVAGNLVELVSLVSYVLKTLVYRLQMWWYNRRRGGSSTT